MTRLTGEVAMTIHAAVVPALGSAKLHTKPSALPEGSRPNVANRTCYWSTAQTAGSIMVTRAMEKQKTMAFRSVDIRDM